MIRQVMGSLRGLLIIALAMGVILSANTRSATHDLSELAKIIAEHHAEVEAHGHPHEDIVDLMHAYHGHSHEIADHDHNIAFLPPRDALRVPMPDGTVWAMANHGLPDRREYGLDRPPRI